jgi:hypothetical protein
MNAINKEKSNGNFLLLPKWAKFGNIYHKIWGYFSQGKCTYQCKKKKFSRSQENEVIRVIICENASFYSMNSNPAEN